MIIDAFDIKQISLSKILDAFIIENEACSTIVNFLKLHDDEFLDLTSDSLYWNRLFQLDFILKCKQDEAEYILSKLEFLNGFTAKYLIWQILRSDSKKANDLKHKCRKILEHKRTKTRHPYASKPNCIVKIVDDICTFLASRDNIAAFSEKLNSEEFAKFCSSIEFSLYQNRILQYDIFSSLNIAKKYLFVHKIMQNDHCNIYSKMRFVMQVLESNEDISVKSEILNLFLKNKNVNETVLMMPTKIENLVNNCGSIEEFLLKAEVMNINFSRRNIIEIMIVQPSLIAEWAKFDSQSLDRILNISRFSTFIADFAAEARLSYCFSAVTII